MRRILLVSSIALMAMNMGLYAQEKDTAQVEPKVKLELVYQFDSTKLHLGGKLITEIRSALKYKTKGILQEDIEWVLNKIRLDLVMRTKKLYTENGEEIDIPYFLYLPHSSNYKYFILNTCDYTQRIAENPRSKLIRTNDGEVIWEVRTMMIDVFVANDGAVTVDVTPALPPLTRNLKNVRFYNQKGILIKVAEDLCTFPMWADMTNDGNLFVIWDKASRLLAFDNKGNEKWHISLLVDDPKLNFFNSSQYLICAFFANGGGHTLLIDDKGSIVQNFDFVIRKGIFTDDEKYLIFNVAKDFVYYLDTETGKIFREEIGNNLDGELGKYFVNLYDKLGIEGVVMLAKNSALQAVFLKEGEVSPNNHIITTPRGIYTVEVENER